MASVGSNAGVGRRIMKHIIAPTALSLADLLEARDKFDAVDPFGHFISQLIFHSQPQRCPVRDWQRLTVHFISEDRLG